MIMMMCVGRSCCLWTVLLCSIECGCCEVHTNLFRSPNAKCNDSLLATDYSNSLDVSCALNVLLATVR